MATRYPNLPFTGAMANGRVGWFRAPALSDSEEPTASTPRSMVLVKTMKTGSSARMIDLGKGNGRPAMMASQLEQASEQRRLLYHTQKWLRCRRQFLMDHPIVPRMRASRTDRRCCRRRSH